MNPVASASRRKRLGQHFLIDPQVIGDIVALINPTPQDVMVEIGPGRGAITEKFVNRVAHLHAIEIDEQLVHALRKKLHSDSIEIHHADALNFFYPSLCTENKKNSHRRELAVFHIYAIAFQATGMRELHTGYVFHGAA